MSCCCNSYSSASPYGAYSAAAVAPEVSSCCCAARVAAAAASPVALGSLPYVYNQTFLTTALTHTPYNTPYVGTLPFAYAAVPYAVGWYYA
jgi:hypothetical protein